MGWIGAAHVMMQRSSCRIRWGWRRGNNWGCGMLMEKMVGGAHPTSIFVKGGERASMGTSNLRLKAADNVDIRGSSYGRVSTREQLYDPRIFGPAEDLRCSCGKQMGEEAIGRMCDECGVFVVLDAWKVRRERLGHIGLPPF